MDRRKRNPTSKGFSRLNRETLEKVAMILGESCAAFKALKKAEEYKTPAFFRDDKTLAIVVVELGACNERPSEPQP